MNDLGACFSSEERFDQLKDKSKATKLILDEVANFQNNQSLITRLMSVDDESIKLDPDSKFKYDDQPMSYLRAIHRGEEVTLAVVQSNGLTISFGLVEVPENDSVEIYMIDVGDRFRRSRGRKSSVEIEDQDFEIGVGHVLVEYLVSSLSHALIRTNATTSESRYIFKSLGFESYDTNPCLLQLKK